MTNGFNIRGFWSCPDCGYANIAHGRGPPYICDECTYQLNGDEEDDPLAEEE